MVCVALAESSDGDSNVTEWTSYKTLLLCDGWAEGRSVDDLSGILEVTVASAASKAQRIGLPSRKPVGRNPIEFACAHCGETVNRPKLHTYCSRRCSGLANTARADAARSKCPVCGGKRRASSDSVHCSVACGLVANGYANQKHKDDFKAKVRELWDAGVSAKRIADSVNPPVTKNAIIGLVHRMGLPSRVNPIRTMLYGPPRPPSVRRTVVRDGVKRKIRIPIPDRTLSALPSLQRAAPIIPPKGERVVRVPEPRPERPQGRVEPCCFPIGEPGTKSFRFCDVPSEPGQQYCSDHMKIAYIRTPRISTFGLVA